MAKVGTLSDNCTPRGLQLSANKCILYVRPEAMGIGDSGLEMKAVTREDRQLLEEPPTQAALLYLSWAVCLLWGLSNKVWGLDAGMCTLTPPRL